MRFSFRLLLFITFVLPKNIAKSEQLVVPGQYPEIQLAVDAAEQGDEILVAPGTYQPFSINGKSVTVRSADLTQSVIVDGQSAQRCLEIYNVSEPGVSIQGLSFVNGWNVIGSGTVRGGGVFIQDSHVELIDVIIENCRIERSTGPETPNSGGGGIFASGSNLNFERVNIDNNSALINDGGSSGSRLSGAGLYAESCTASFVECSVSNNYAFIGTTYGSWHNLYGYGAGAAFFYSSVSAQDSSFSDNDFYLLNPSSGVAAVGCGGGGISAYECDSLVLNNCALQRNSLRVESSTTYTTNYNYANGGGLAVNARSENSGPFLISGCVIQDNVVNAGMNRPGNSGGCGIEAFRLAPITIQGTRIENNVVEEGASGVSYGYGIRSFGTANLQVQDSVICGNGPTDDADGQLWNQDAPLTFIEPVCLALDCINCPVEPDCDGDGTSDADEIANGEAGDINQNGLPDNCEPDCDGDGTPDFVELESGSFDCNDNTIPDECEIADGSSADSNSNGVVDACELDCNGNTFFDFLELDLGLAEDCDQNMVPDDCDIADGSQSDCNLDGIPDSCVPFEDCDSNGVPDECQIDTDQDGSIDACDADDDGDDIPDECDVDSFVGPEGAQYWDPAEGGNGHWYMGTAAPGISWEDAAAQAEALGGYLCTVPSAEENIWVFINVASDPSLWNTWFGPWIGGYQDTSSPEYSEPDGAWSWVTGEPWSYTNWGPGDPSNSNGQDHAAFGGIPSDEIRFTWNDLAAPEPGGFIVEWSGASDCNGNGVLDSCEVDTDQDGIPDECDPDVDGDGIPNECDVDQNQSEQPDSLAVLWPVADGGNGHWYLFEAASTSFSGALDEAQTRGGYLATVTSQQESDFLWETFGVGPYVWVGGVRDMDEPDPTSGWSWVTGEPFSYTAWGDGQPDGEPYLTLRNFNSSYVFDDWHAYSHPYFIEWQPSDCNTNGVLDSCEDDSDTDGIIDECDPDDDNDGVPDECDPESTGGFDCDANGIDDACELGDDCNSNLIPDRCESDLDEDGVIDACDPDDDNDGVPDECDPRSTGGEDCDFNGVDDSCEPDVDQDGIIDACDDDDDGDGIPDECDVTPSGDESLVTCCLEDATCSELTAEVCASSGGFVQAPGMDCSNAECPNILEASWTVDDDFIERPDADFSSIQDAIDAASDGDVIVVYPGVYAESAQDWCLRVDNLDVRILAVGDRLVTVDGQNERGFLRCEGNVSSNTVIRGIQFTNASPSLTMMSFENGNPSPTIKDCTFMNLVCRGIIISRSATATFESCEFSSIDVVDGAKGIYADYSPLEFRDCLFSDITTDRVFLFAYYFSGQVEFTHCVFEDLSLGLNQGSDDLYGLFFTRDGAGISCDSCSFFGNTNQSTLGDCLFVGDVALQNCVVCDNPSPLCSYTDLGGNTGCIISALQWTENEGGNGHWYEFVQSGDISFLAARELAQAAGGDLAVIDSEDTNTWIVESLISDPDVWYTQHGPWIGLFQDLDAPDYVEPAGGWYWVNGAPLQYSDWADGVGCQDMPAEFRCSGVPGCDYATYYSLPGEATPVTSWGSNIESGDGYQRSYIIEWSADCNNDGIVDYGQILDGTFTDEDQNGIPDECDSNSPSSILVDSFADFGDPASGLSYLWSSDLDLQNLSQMTFFDNHQGEGRVCYASDFGSDCFITAGEVHPNDSQDCSQAQFGRQIPVLEYVYTGQITSDASISLNLNKECNDCLSGCPGITPVRVQLSINSEVVFEQTDYAFDLTYEFDFVLEPGSTVRLAVFPENGCHCDETQYRLVIRDTSGENDCNGNGVLDSCELEDNDCNTNGIPDDCEGFEDCNGNGTGDVCDIASGASQDINQDGVPDECQCIADFISDGVVDFQEVLGVLNDWGPCGPPCPPDINADGEVGFIDLLRVLDAWGPCDP